MAMQKIMTNALLLLSLVALTACPDNSQDRNNIVTPQAQTPPQGGNIGGNPANGLDQLDTIMKTIQCEFEGQRTNSSKYFNSNVSIPKTIALISLDSRIGTIIDLRTKFLGFDIGKFGNISMRYVPAARTRSGTDTIVLADEGLNKNLRMSQSGYAGQVVKLEALDDNMFVTVSCKGTSQFKSGSASSGKTKLVCHGKSSTPIAAEEEIDKTIPLDSVQADEEFEISKEVRAKLDKEATTITFMGSIDPEYAPEITSTASLKSSATFEIKELGSSTKINVTCKLQ